MRDFKEAELDLTEVLQKGGGERVEKGRRHAPSIDAELICRQLRTNRISCWLSWSSHTAEQLYKSVLASSLRCQIRSSISVL
ncbi:hypothetical protein EVAR_60386_1 [Eumeta japonica]|uniref:Uncharacterized protein n=1 Tax=Eumeta variegata TaxID=151549 RepID=A0A4C2A2Z4_EUMVA|nr:hypothetical protein EVAR_60386_1 [Eumeta japonica]